MNRQRFTIVQVLQVTHGPQISSVLARSLVENDRNPDEYITLTRAKGCVVHAHTHVNRHVFPLFRRMSCAAIGLSAFIRHPPLLSKK